MIKKLSLRELFRNAVLHDVKASRKDAFQYFLNSVKDNSHAIETLALEHFEREYANWRVEKDRTTGSHMLVGTQKTQRRVEVSAELREQRQAERDERVASAVTQVKRVILLDLPMSNGKKARDCTGAELDRMGDAWKEVATHLKPTQVLDKHLSERDLQNIFSRYETKKRRAGTELHA